MTSGRADLIRRLDACPHGLAGWREFEDVCVEILTYLFVPPLSAPHIQARSFSGIDRRDAVFPNREFASGTLWGQLYRELAARLVLFEFKNYDTEEIGKEEVDQTRNYLTQPMGKLAILCCNKVPNGSAHQRRNSVFGQEQKVILFLAPEHLKEMLFAKERGDDPAGLIVDLVERFYIQHE